MTAARGGRCSLDAPRGLGNLAVHEDSISCLEMGTTGMWAFFERLLDSSTLSPHGICLLWEPELIWLHVVSDAVIAASYFSIPVALSIFVSKRRDVDFGWIFWAFALFIMACGFTHVLSIVTLWVPVYGIEGLIKAMTALASIITADDACGRCCRKCWRCRRRRSFARPSSRWRRRACSGARPRRCCVMRRKWMRSGN